MSYSLTVGLQTILFVAPGDHINLTNKPSDGSGAINYVDPKNPPFGISGGITRVGSILHIASADYGGFVTILEALGVPIPELGDEQFR